MTTNAPPEASARSLALQTMGIGVLLALGLALVAIGMVELGPAQSYRQRFGEGMVFVPIGIVLLIGGSISSVATGWLAVLGLLRGARFRRYAWTASTVVVAVLGACAGLALWTVWHAPRCIFTCPGS